MKKVGVVITCYNYGEYLEKAVESVLDSTYSDIDIVVVDDGSTDEYTANLLDNFSYPNCRVLRIDNSGPANARNVGIAALDCEFILPLDADDYIHPNYIDKAVKVFEDMPTIDVVYCKAEYVGDRAGIWELPAYDKRTMVTENCIFVSAFFRKTMWEQVGGFNTNMVHGMEDYDFWLSFVERDANVHMIDEVLFYYRVKSNSRTARQYDNYLATHVKLFNNHRELFCDNIDLLYKLVLATDQYATLFFDLGEGISADLSIRKHRITSKTDVELVFDLSNVTNIKSLRFDPTEGIFSTIKIKDMQLICIDDTIIDITDEYITSNGRYVGGNEYFFLTTDPNFYIDGVFAKETVSLKVIYVIEEISSNELQEHKFFKDYGDNQPGVKTSMKLLLNAIKRFLTKA